MFSIIVRTEPTDRDLLIADLWEAGATGITEEPDSVRAFFDGDQEQVVSRFHGLHLLVQEEEPRDWVRFAQDQWAPFEVGERFYLVPEWRVDLAPAGRLRLTIHPGMACGTGTHPATRLCLMAMERHIEAAHSVLDVGTGAGILADAARLLGANRIVGCDIEHDSTVVARGNLDPEIQLFTGSVRSVRSDAFDWAVCNLNATTLGTLASELRRVSRGLILSGFREDEAARVTRTLRSSVREEMELDGYGCLVF